MMIAVGLIVIGVISRFIIHIPNFSPLSAIALFSGVYLSKTKYGWLIPLSIYILSDIFIGLHKTVIFTWSAMLFIYYLGIRLRVRKDLRNVFFFTVLSSVSFFIITNFGVWLFGWYGYSWEGLVKCFIYALPFFRMSLISNIIYTFVLFGCMEFFLLRENAGVSQKISV